MFFNMDPVLALFEDEVIDDPVLALFDNDGDIDNVPISISGTR